MFVDKSVRACERERERRVELTLLRFVTCTQTTNSVCALKALFIAMLPIVCPPPFFIIQHTHFDIIRRHDRGSTGYFFLLANRVGHILDVYIRKKGGLERHLMCGKFRKYHDAFKMSKLMLF